MDKSTLITDKARKYVAEYLQTDVGSLEVLPVSGGYSLNRKSLVSSHGKWIFVKEVDIEILAGDGKAELGWLKKEHELTRYLTKRGFGIAPEWSQLSDDGTVLILPAYRAEDGWVWSFPQDDEMQKSYIEAIVNSSLSLESAQFSSEDINSYELMPHFRESMTLGNSVQLMMSDDTERDQIFAKLDLLAERGYKRDGVMWLKAALSDNSALEKLDLDIQSLALQPNATFGHCDVRSDNIAHNTITGEVKFLDWNWASYTPSKFGSTEFLIEAVRRGVNIKPWLQYINPALAAAMLGFYIKRCIREPLQVDDTRLRDMQAETAVASYMVWRDTLDTKFAKTLAKLV